MYAVKIYYWFIIVYNRIIKMSDLREEDKYSMGLYLIKSGRVENANSRYWKSVRANILGKYAWYWNDKKSIDHSLCYGAFLKESGKQIGFSRVITDYDNLLYLWCDCR